MISYADAGMESLSIHHTGNPSTQERYTLSSAPLPVQEDMLRRLLLQYFLMPFEKATEIFRFTHSSADPDLNEMFHFASAIFEAPETIHENSIRMLKHLYSVSNHPKIKPGELYVAYFKHIKVEGRDLDAIGIFKSESKESYLKVSSNANGFDMGYEEEAINIKKLDKGCLIFNHEREEGYKVAIVDNTNRSAEAAYWVDAFLQLKMRNDDYQQTHATLSAYKNFINEKIEDVFEINQAEKIDMLNRSIKYFKQKDHFDMEEFGNEVIGDKDGIESFKNYKQDFEKEFETVMPDQFAISDAAVKKQARMYRAVLKLDKNFHIYIHGSHEMIEKGFDQPRNLNYYKVYFNEEQ
ncbi:MAG: hypothetical protein JWQ27_3090 [Ferruginibacter sp.]|nr:hypothetical protein [Ferruginibacter sp.]